VCQITYDFGTQAHCVPDPIAASGPSLHSKTINTFTLQRPGAGGGTY
jgi:hypothetical protein